MARAIDILAAQAPLSAPHAQAAIALLTNPATKWPKAMIRALAIDNPHQNVSGAIAQLAYAKAANAPLADTLASLKLRLARYHPNV